MKNKHYLIDRSLHWFAAFLILFILMNMGTQIHNIDYRIKGQALHRQDAIETHALMALGVFGLILARLGWEKLFVNRLPRQPMRSTFHLGLVKSVHACFYLILSGLVITGLGMAINAEVVIQLFGVQLSDAISSDGRFYAKMLDIHLMLIDTLWWLIGLHFLGVLYARK
ncbi:cytochrome b/b6 domain-containing protein [Pseudoalteromonas luteoviolacea]|uniref:cytochrome b/b6 domain-containing protein n=1 Tax=Pseudoalteromonas luteoviolacea TaxID=43657 RepID=UPI001B3A12E0|nr:cytochrome b/b6 domain-containing protein [Pseudoalteromonas luteoviolacea]MBQ4879101.1 cytochrome b/b6 domain-containing protein [Pseudoalteromonas luteoviolacea]MBQ4908144.1 cytochrome b/b6 domain-containing protein [Pseudoalteromonas luteoviolacea]